MLYLSAGCACLMDCCDMQVHFFHLWSVTYSIFKIFCGFFLEKDVSCDSEKAPLLFCTQNPLCSVMDFHWSVLCLAWSFKCSLNVGQH